MLDSSASVRTAVQRDLIRRLLSDGSVRRSSALLAAGVQPVTFGPIVFRVETAALFILSALQYAWLK